MFAAILIAASSNLDNLGVGVAFGMRGTRIRAIANVIIAAATMAGTAGAMSFGRALSNFIASPVAASLGAVIIIGVGAATILASLDLRATPHCSSMLDRALGGRQRDATDPLCYRQACVLGLALSLNNVASGVGAGIAGIPLLATALLAGAFSLLCISGGSAAGKSLARSLLGSRAPLVSGFALVAIGTAMLFGAL